MTSGGLLAAVPDPAGIDGWTVGRLLTGTPGSINVT
jgi:hypothetical protein